MINVETISSNTSIPDFSLTTPVYLVDSSSDNVEVSLPTAVKCAGQEIYIKKISADNEVAVVPYGSETINGSGDYTLTDENQTIHFVSDGANWVFVAAGTSSGTTYTANRALATDDDGNIVASSVSDTDLGYLQNVTSDIQIQINNKLTTPSFATFTPTVTLVGGAGNTTPVYSTNTGRYATIGQMVYVDVLLDGDGGAEGAGTGVFTVALPVESNSAQPDYYFNAGWALNNSSEYYLLGKIAASASVMSLRFINGTTGTDFTGAHQDNATRRVRLKFCYEKVSA